MEQLRPVRFVLDHNFLWQQEDFNWPGQLPAHIRIRSLASVDRRLIRDHDDWEILRTLGERGDIDGYITNDARMLTLSREMVAMTDINLTLVITDGVGHDKVRATALVMLHLVPIASQVTSKPQIFRLRPAELRTFRLDPHAMVNAIAQRQGLNPADLIQQERLEMRRILESKRRGRPR